MHMMRKRRTLDLRMLNLSSRGEIGGIWSSLNGSATGGHQCIGPIIVCIPISVLSLRTGCDCLYENDGEVILLTKHKSRSTSCSISLVFTYYLLTEPDSHDM